MKIALRFDRNAILLWPLAVAVLLSSTASMAGPTGVKPSAPQVAWPQTAAPVTTLPAAAPVLSGESKTLLPSGYLLLVGGQDAHGVQRTALLQDPQSGVIRPLSAELSYARAWHSATILPDGSVLILGGIGGNGAIVSAAERLNAAGTVFQGVVSVGLTQRAYHTATLLTDGRVLIIGGVGADGRTLASIELWDFSTGQSTTLPVGLLTPRSRQTATLLPDGTVLVWGGIDALGEPVPYGEIIDPTTATVRLQATALLPSSDPQPPQLETSLPQDGASDVPVNVLLSLRFSKPLSVTAVNASSVTLTGPDGVVSANVVPAEGGMLVFVTPQTALQGGAVYTLSLAGLSDGAGQILPDTSISFTTAGTAIGGDTGGSGGDNSSADSGQSSASPGSPASASGAGANSNGADSASQALSNSASTGPAPTTLTHFSVKPVPFEQLSQAMARATNLPKARLVHAMDVPDSAPAPPEIVELARALKYDPDLIYQYVHDNIEFSPLFGVLKGPVGTLLDGRGDSFDQAALMVALLNQASLNNSSISNVMFEFGQLNLTSAQLQSWLGVDTDAYSVLGVLAEGSIPGNVNANGNTLVSATVGHVWVKVSINGTAYVFDPAFKYHTWTTGVSNLAGIMGYQQPQFLADAGGTVTSTSIQGVNRTALRNDLASYADNLASYIRNNPNLALSDIVGGSTIVPTPFANGQTVRQTVNPNQYGTPTDWSSIPSGNNGFIAMLSIALPGAATQTYDSDDIYGHRMSIFFNSSYVPTLYLDGVPQVSGSASSKGASVGVTFTVTLPWAIGFNNGNAFTQVHTQNIVAQTNQNNGGYIVQNAWDQVGRSMIEKHRKLLNQAIAAGDAANSEPLLGESLEVLGYTWLAEVAAQQHLSDQLLGTVSQYFYGVGIVGEAVGSTISSPYVDLPMNLVNPPARLNGQPTLAGNSLADFLDISGVSSSFESASLEQTQAQVPGFVAASTVKLLDMAVQSGDTIYDINNGSNNWSTIEPLLAPNYNASDLQNIGNNYVNNGYRVIAPLHGKIQVGAWTGVGFKAVESSGNSLSFFEIISGGLSGGFAGTNDLPPDFNLNNLLSDSPASVSLTADSASATITPGGTGVSVLDPIDHQKGSYNYQHDDLTVGPTGFPYGLNFQRSYDSGAQGTAGPLGSGWTHNYAITAKVDSDGFAGMGQASPLNAASAIAALYVSSDLVNGQAVTGQQNLENFVLETVVNRWFTDQLTSNVVNVMQGWNTTQFVKMADGTYSPPLGSAAILDGSVGAFRYRTPTGVTINFNSSGQISTWTSASGASVSFGYAGGHLSSVTNSATGRQLTLSYNGSQLSSVTDGSRTVSYGYTSGNLTSFTDALSQLTSFAYDTSGSFDTAGHLTQVFYPSNPSNPFVTNSYDSLGRVKQQVDANGNASQMFIAGARTEFDDAVGNRHVFYNDPRGNILEEIQDYGPSPHLNTTVTNIYNAQTLLVLTTLPEGNSAQYTYDADFNPLTTTQYPKPGSALSPLVQTVTYTTPVASLPNFEEVRTSTDPNGNVTTYSYNPTGTVSKIDHPAVPKPGSGNLTPEEDFTYTAIGLIQTSTDAEGRVTSYAYNSGNADEVQTLTVDYGRLNLVTTYGYDSYGDVNSVTDANGNQTVSQFDHLRRVTQVNAPASTGAVTKYTYFPDGPVQSMARELPSGNWETTQYTYTLADKVSVVTDPLGNTTTTTYDADERVQTVTQEVSATSNRQRTTSYDALSRLSQISDTTSTPATVLETHSYTLNGKPHSFTDANNNVITYAYDGFDRPITTTYPDNSTDSVTQYDSNGNVLTRTTRSGQTITLTYDALNRVATKTPQGEAAGPVTYGYDLTGRLLQASDQSSNTPYVVGYDTAGRANSYTDQQGRATAVQYDPVGNRTQLQWPAGTNGANPYYVTYQYDALNRMKEIDENGSSATPLAKYQWDTLSRQTLITYGDGTTDAYSLYDAGDNLQTLTQSFAGTGNSVTFSYAWFDNHQRQSTGVNNGMFQYVPPPGTTDYAPADVDNAYTSLTSSSSATFTYDGNHNLTYDGTNTLTYDVENRLIQAQNAGWGTSTYLYDPLGHRKQKSVSLTNSSTQFVLAGDAEIADYNCNSGTCIPWALTVRGVGGLPVVSITPGSGGHTYYHHDVLGSTTAATVPGMNGAAEVYTYSEFGATSSGSLAYRFGGYRYDAETSLYYVHARYYSPALGRFLQTDPAGLSGGTNLYAYVGNDPINLIDPSGLAPDIPASAGLPAPDISNLLGPTSSQINVPPPPGCDQCMINALTVTQVANIIFNENNGVTPGSSDPQDLQDAKVMQANAVMNADEAYGEERMQYVHTAPDTVSQAQATSPQYQQALQAAETAYQQQWAGTDPTDGNMFFNNRPTDSTAPRNLGTQSVDVVWQGGPFSLGKQTVYIDIYQNPK